MKGVLLLLPALCICLNRDYNHILDNNVGLATIISRKALEYGKNISMAIINNQIRKLDIPNINDAVKIMGAQTTISELKFGQMPDPITSLHVLTLNKSILSGILIKSRLLPKIFQIDNSSDDGMVTLFRLNISEMSISLSAKYTSTFGSYIVNEGNINVEFKETNLQFDVIISRDDDQQKANFFCKADGVINISFVGGLSTFLNLGSRLFKKNIKNMIFDQICKRSIETLEKILDETHIENNIALSDNVKLDINLLEKPELKNGEIILRQKGKLYFTKNKLTIKDLISPSKDDVSTRIKNEFQRIGSTLSNNKMIYILINYQEILKDFILTARERIILNSKSMEGELLMDTMDLENIRFVEYDDYPVLVADLYIVLKYPHTDLYAFQQIVATIDFSYFYSQRSNQFLFKLQRLRFVENVELAIPQRILKSYQTYLSDNIELITKDGLAIDIPSFDGIKLVQPEIHILDQTNVMLAFDLQANIEEIIASKKKQHNRHDLGKQIWDKFKDGIRTIGTSKN